MKSRILVTGGNGRLGRAVLAALDGQGIPGVRRPDFGRDAIIIGDNGHVDPAMLNGIAAIINCAGNVTGTSAQIRQANVAYPTELARAARSAGVGRFVQVSSFAVYGKVERIDGASAIMPVGEYGHSKIVAEQALAAIAADGFRVVPLRLPFMFSAAEPALLGRLVSMMLKLRVLPKPGAGSSLRSMITYAGAADALISLALAPDAPSGPLVAADPEPLDLTMVAHAIRARLNKRIAILPVPDVIVGLLDALGPGVFDRLFRSSVLSPSVNYLAGGSRHGVTAELNAYLDRLA